MAKRNDKPGARLAKSKTCQERRIKVLPIGYEYKPKAQQDNPYFVTPAVPWIQMKGKWLEQAGFTIDTSVKIRVMEGCLVLTVDTNPISY